MSRRVSELICVIAVALLTPALASLLQRFALSGRDGTDSKMSASRLSISDSPIRLLPNVDPIFSTNSIEARAIDALLGEPPDVPIDGPVAIHLVRAYRGAAIHRMDVHSGSDVLSALLGRVPSTRPGIESPLTESRYGVRYHRADLAQDGSLGENHRDVFLATYAEVGLPLSTPLRVGDVSKYTVADLLEDSIANFNLGQKEIEWTAIAYALYMPKVGIWRNRDSEQFTLDQLARELLSRDLDGATCGGVHLLMAMSYLVRANPPGGVTLAVRNELVQKLRGAVAKVRNAQRNDGSWTLRWQLSFEPYSLRRPTDLSEQIVATGHLTEWLTYLPKELQPPQDVYLKAARWLIAHGAWGECRTVGGSVCAWTHSICALQNLRPAE